MNTEDTTKRRRLGSPGAEAAAATDVSHNDAMASFKRRVDLMEASFQREILEMKRVCAEVLAKNTAIESQLSSLKDENDRLKAKVSQLDEENLKTAAVCKTHALNMDWKYSAPDPPSDSYWIEQGYDYGDEDITDEDYIENINEHFFQYAKEQSEKLRYGTFGLSPEDDSDDLIQFGCYNEDADEPLIRYDVALLPHWVEFCSSMKSWLSSVNGTIEETFPFRVYLCNIEMPSNVLKLLRECLEQMGLGHVEDLQLWRNDFQGSNGIDFAIEVMQSQKKMRYFSYQRNPVDNGQDCQRLVDAIVSHPSLSNCYFDGLCEGERNGHDYLVCLLSKEVLKEVSFENCGVDTGGQSALFDIVKLHPKLDCLRLDNNKLNDKDAVHLADALRHNRILKGLWLNGNQFTKSGEEILKKVIYDDSSLNALADSNHVCTIEGLNFTSDEGYSVDDQGWNKYNVYRNMDIVREGDDGSKRSRAHKIFHFLGRRSKGSRSSLLEIEMGEDMLKVLPLALATVQRCGEEWSQKVDLDEDSNDIVIVKDKGGNKSAELSVTYELLLSWHVTVLCQSRLNSDR